MKNSNIILLKTLLLSTSKLNLYRHSSDAKKRRKILSGIIGAVFMYGMLMAYCVSMTVGYGYYGIIDAAPVMCALLISVLSFVFTFFRTNGYLFNFKEYDMLMSLPFEVKSIAACKFLYMYIKSLPWHLSISVAMLAGYGFFARPGIIAYALWFVLTFFLPVIPMLISAFIGFLIARVSAGFRKTNIVQTVISFVFVIFCFLLRYILEDMFRNDKVQETLESMSAVTDKASGYYLPVSWFSGAVTKNSFVDVLLLIGLSVLLFGIVFIIVGNSYRNINSALKSHAAAKKYRMSGQKQRSVVKAVAFKEFKRFTGSTTYMVNTAIGEILALLFGIVTLVVGFDRIISVVAKDAPLEASLLQPAIPYIVYFFIGMVSTTAISPSLEGKNYWIVQSLPIEKKMLYRGKMLFNVYLTVPFMVFSEACLCIATKAPLLNSILYLVLGVVLCLYSTSWGCVCGIRRIRLDWENEIEVIKQSSAVAIYMLPNMFAVMGLCVGAVFLGTKVSHILITLIMIIITSAMAALSYVIVMLLAKKNGE